MAMVPGVVQNALCKGNHPAGMDLSRHKRIATDNKILSHELIST
jgi:hypothetical protein